MPKKSVWEMNALERVRNSLGAKTFRAVVLLSLILSVAAVAFGYYLYVSSVRREYRVEAWHMSQISAKTLDMEEIRADAAEILSIYMKMSPEEQLEEASEAYRAKFSSVEDFTFRKIKRQIRAIQTENDARASYIAALDVVNNRMVFVVDGDPTESNCPPGSWDSLEPELVHAFLKGAPVSRLDAFYGAEPIPSVIAEIENYGNRVTAGTRLMEVNGYPVFMFIDLDMQMVEKVSRTFLLQYILLLLAVTIGAAFLMTRGLRRSVVKPINDLAEAAESYVDDRRNGRENGSHFDSLDIRTGDEIENLSLTMKGMEAELTDYMRDLTRVTAEKERINTELNVASQIQEGVIPHIYPAFPERPEFDIYATMNPAKEVGGDFYDFFLIDEDHLAIVMADVSGKGIPAALFMMASKIMINNISQMQKDSPGKILSEVNAQICKNNPAEMFVTVWLGILEISTGKLRAANAGHEYPSITQAGGAFDLYKDKHGFVIGGMDGMQYKEYELTLAPGDLVFQYTDGVTEATNEAGELFGTERMIDALNKENDRTPEAAIRRVTEAIDGFVDGAEQFDDITMLCLYYAGPQAAQKGE